MYFMEIKSVSKAKEFITITFTISDNVMIDYGGTTGV
jgi:hypothetical protein